MRNVRHIIGLSLLLAGLQAVAAERTMPVQMENSPLRSEPQAFGQVLARVPRNEKVVVIKEQGPWMQVRRASGETGWMSAGSLRKPRINLSSGTTTAQGAAGVEEQALATKGFNSKIEASFRTQNPNLDFSWLDRMEKMKIPDERIVKFLKEGGLQTGGGAP